MAKAFPNTGVTIIDSSSDLPAASVGLEGVLMFQKDTNELKICDGSNWISVIDTDTPPTAARLAQTNVQSKTMTGTWTNSTSLTFTDVSGGSGDELSVSITPSSTASKILVMVAMSASGTSSAQGLFKLVRGSTDIALGNASGSRTRVSANTYAGSDWNHRVSIIHLDSPATTSATTYKVVGAPNTANAVYVNRTASDSDVSASPRSASNITVMEILV